VPTLEDETQHRGLLVGELTLGVKLDFPEHQWIRSGQTREAARLVIARRSTPLPMAMSVAPENAARRLTPSSGALVAKATTVRPITSGVTRSAAAMADAP